MANQKPLMKIFQLQFAIETDVLSTF